MHSSCMWPMEVWESSGMFSDTSSSTSSSLFSLSCPLPVPGLVASSLLSSSCTIFLQPFPRAISNALSPLYSLAASYIILRVGDGAGVDEDFGDIGGLVEGSEVKGSVAVDVSLGQQLTWLHCALQ
eukprot:TRINITY_DN3299_c0_g1_i2.p1 TRINITY_DN3299_c0_g1~~TRINITY_DN3299_c0_g1_i2.p1  ORF type:complete len:126 (+),score=1.68 TRINITY_DN3299_c0_g1_i2:171-548(+)